MPRGWLVIRRCCGNVLRINEGIRRRHELVQICTKYRNAKDDPQDFCRAESPHRCSTGIHSAIRIQSSVKLNIGFSLNLFRSAHTRGQDRFTELLRLISQPRVSLEEEVGPDDVFLTPDIYRDLRRNALPDFVRRTRARTSASQRDFEVVPGATPS